MQDSCSTAVVLVHPALISCVPPPPPCGMACHVIPCVNLGVHHSRRVLQDSAGPREQGLFRSAGGNLAISRCDTTIVLVCNSSPDFTGTVVSIHYIFHTYLGQCNGLSCFRHSRVFREAAMEQSTPRAFLRWLGISRGV